MSDDIRVAQARIDRAYARIRKLEAALREAIQWMRDSAEGEEGAGFHKSAVKELEVADRWESVLGSTSETEVKS